MYTTRLLFKLSQRNTNLQRYAVVWTPTRNVNFLQRCKECLNTVLKGKQETICEKGQLTEENAVTCMTREDVKPAVPLVPLYSANVVVVGAGMSGLTAANHLLENGVGNVTVLEALDRPGGQIKSTWFHDAVIELGSDVAKSSGTNPIAKDMFLDGLMTPQLNGADFSRGLLLKSDGSSIPHPISLQVYQTFKQILAEAHEIEAASSFQTRTSIPEFIGSRIDQEIAMFPRNQIVEAERLFLGLASLFLAKSSHDDSLKVSNKFGDYLQLPGSCTMVPLGFFAEINTLYESLPENVVQFNKPVVKIKWGGVSDVFPRAVVITDSGEEFPADYVIITVPIGVLKAYADCLFCPGLPAGKLDAIMKIPIGHSNKIFLQFEQPFWRWKRDIEKMTFDPEEMECREGWMKGLTSLEPIHGSDHIMCLTVSGPQAQCMESLSDPEVICDVVKFLKEMFCKEDVPDPIKIKRTQWSSDPRFLGAFATTGPGVDSQDFFNLATPLPEQTDFCDPVLLFAGAATCPVQFGTVEGAKSSGIREAERLIQLIRLQEQTDKEERLNYQLKC
ncbi:peroxisomal N(1)-acetyl-spermine/spermidine oxidase-like [Macrosteles quadrilineatus]|uniref:peroxisomal N(1)-acetyl-spermine/spermidine oxidase-like n=1 Tax=Macrosteles quadrilineatus TaxID=74068 RepID=UPI0023E33B0C|nr:peroxisomal N(1)-acetyl-spermine/spermidine oxidase-like [Macrosteles quadrilineatus]